MSNGSAYLRPFTASVMPVNSYARAGSARTCETITSTPSCSAIAASAFSSRNTFFSPSTGMSASMTSTVATALGSTLPVNWFHPPPTGHLYFDHVWQSRSL